MKNFLKGFIAFAVIAATIVSCNTTPSMSPSDVAIKFTKATLLANFDSAKIYVASNSTGVFSQTEDSYKAVPLPDSLKQIFSQAVVTSVGETKLNDSTINEDLSVKLPTAIMGQQEVKQPLVLVKEKGEWKVDLIATQHKIMEDKGMPVMQQATPEDTVPPTPPDTAAPTPAPKTK